MERNTDRILNYLQDHPTATNGEIGTALDIDDSYVRRQISLFKNRGWLEVEGAGKDRHIRVTRKEPENMTEFKREIYTEMLPTLMWDFEQATNIQDRNMVAKMIFRVLENL